MPDHLSALGFRIETVDAFKSLAHMAVEEGTPFVCAQGSYIHWSWGQPIEFWVQADEQLQLSGCHPFFDSGQHKPWVVRQWIEDPNYTLDGHVLAQTPDGQGPPWLLQVPDFGQHTQHTDTPIDFATVAFIHHVDFLDDDDVVLSYAPSNTSDSTTSVVQSHATVTATIKHATLSQNKLSKGRFWHLELQTCMGHLDAVCASSQMKKRPKTGATINFQGWFVGRPVCES